MEDPHHEVIITHHPVLPGSGRPRYVRCHATDQDSMVVWFQNTVLCEACGNELGKHTQVSITWRHENGQVYLAFF